MNKPFEKIDDCTNQIFNATWQEIMPSIPSDSVDMVITSPPYNIDLGNNKFRKKGYDTYKDDLPYDEYLNLMDDLFFQCYRVLKSGGRICVNIGDHSNGRVPTHADFIVRMRDKSGFIHFTTIVWDKQNIAGGTSWGSYCSPSFPSFPTQFEFIIVMSKETLRHDGDKSKITVSPEDFKRNSRALWRFVPENQMMKTYDHPAMFPEELPLRLIQQLTYEDDVVLDPFSGAGTTCAVAKKTRRRYIGIEMSKKYHATSLRRLREIPLIEINKDGQKVAEWMN